MARGTQNAEKVGMRENKYWLSSCVYRATFNDPGFVEACILANVERFANEIGC